VSFARRGTPAKSRSTSHFPPAAGISSSTPPHPGGVADLYPLGAPGARCSLKSREICSLTCAGGGAVGYYIEASLLYHLDPAIGTCRWHEGHLFSVDFDRVRCTFHRDDRIAG
jgi:hypothetical protein